jgi:hypothetical protein
VVRWRVAARRVRVGKRCIVGEMKDLLFWSVDFVAVEVTCDGVER